MKSDSYFVVSLLFLLAPLSVSASVRINEVMYDLEGTDTGREWIELINDGSGSVDISGFKLFEANINHGLTLFSGNPVLAPQSLALIVDDAQKFIADWPHFLGLLFESSFSLSNTGETLALKNGSGTEEDSASYSSDDGAKGDGKTLHRNDSGWSAASATPGTSETESTQPPSETGDVTVSPEESIAETVSTGEQAPRITVYVGEDRRVSVGADSVFEAQGYGTDGAPLVNARYIWSFGDGSNSEGRKVLHSYAYPGKYVVSLSVSSGDLSASDRVIITTHISHLSLYSETDGSVAVFNKSSQDIDIGGWFIRRDGSVFLIPQKTVILSGEGIRLSHTLTQLPFSGLLELLYPNGSLAILQESKSGSELMKEGMIERIAVSPMRVTPAVLGVETEEGQQEPIAEVSPVPLPTTTRQEPPLYPWVLALMSIAGVGAFGTWYIRRLPVPAGRPFAETEMGVLARQFEIIDISEKQD